MQSVEKSPQMAGLIREDINRLGCAVNLKSEAKSATASRLSCAAKPFGA